MLPDRLGALTFRFVANTLFGALLLSPLSGAQTVVETPQQANDRIRSLSSTARSIPHDYVLGNGDLLDIDVFDVKELSREVRVSQTGTIGIPLVPVRLHVSGLTELQTEQKIAEVLEANGLVSHPEVSVSVKERRSKPITVVGAVAHPMVYQADHQVTLLEILAEAGGIANDAGDTVIITRPAVDVLDPTEPPALGQEDPIPAPDKKESSKAAPVTPPAQSLAQMTTSTSVQNPVAPVSPLAAPSAPVSASKPASAFDPPDPSTPPQLSNTITVNLNQLVEDGNATNNLLLQAGDIVTVPHAGIVYVLGSVTRPGGYVLANDRSQMTTLKILALAGGLNNTAKLDRAVIIRKDNQGQQHEVPVDLRKVQKRETEDVQLMPSDILYIPTSGAKLALLKSVEFGIALGSGVALYRLAYR
jgi:polysaccharide biosynthesis/export protein